MPKVRKPQPRLEAVQEPGVVENPVADNDKAVPTTEDDGPERYMEWLSEDETFICADCGSLVVDGETHNAFHSAFARVTDYNGVQ